jgi:hypothetical protein
VLWRTSGSALADTDDSRFALCISPQFSGESAFLQNLIWCYSIKISDDMMSSMRSTVRIDDDLMAELKSRAHQEQISLTRMLNRVLRAGLADAGQAASTHILVRAVDLGLPRVELDKALALAANLEDEEVSRKLSLGK